MVVSWISASTGIEETSLRLLLGMLAGYPLSIIWAFLPMSPYQRHLFSIVTGFWLYYFNYGLEAVHSLICVNVTYLILVAITSRKLCLALSWIFNVSYLFIGYCYTCSADTYNLDWTTSHCVVTLRLIGLCYDLCDGRVPETELDRDQKERRLIRLPSWFELHSFCYHFGGVLVGPQFPFALYDQFVNQKLVPASQSFPTIPALKAFGAGVIYLGTVQLGKIFLHPSVIMSSASLKAHSPPENIFWITLCMRLDIWKYIGIWKLGEAPNIISGLNYNGKDEKGTPRWDRVTNANCIKFESARSLVEVVQNFNINTNNWIKNYVFKRLKFLGNKDISQLLALIYLALWHGYFPGYFICFCTEFLCLQALYVVQRFTGPYVQRLYSPESSSFFAFIARTVFSVASVAITAMFLSYGTIAFQQQSWENSRRVFSAVYWWGHILLLSIYLLGLLLPKGPGKATSPYGSPTSPGTSRKKEQ